MPLSTTTRSTCRTATPDPDGDHITSYSVFSRALDVDGGDPAGTT
jgi:hypothetical protein